MAWFYSATAAWNWSALYNWFVCSFEITDEQGEHVLTVPFTDTVPEEEGWD
jgi:hypothetical protein